MSDSVDTYPSVDLAYGLVPSSYQLLVSRFEAADNRITALLSVVMAVTMGVPLFAKSVVVAQTPTFDSPWFIAGLLAAVSAVTFGMIGRTAGSIPLVNPRIVYEEYLHKDHWTFKKDTIFRAGQHFEKNARAIALKGTYATVVMLAFLVEIGAFWAWLFA